MSALQEQEDEGQQYLKIIEVLGKHQRRGSSGWTLTRLDASIHLSSAEVAELDQGEGQLLAANLGLGIIINTCILGSCNIYTDFLAIVHL